ncbi:MAG: BREX system ATP-binding domain-containing protein [Thermodesulfobacteriota bacterium]
MISTWEDRKAIRSLRVGVVPSSHVLKLTVGSEHFKNVLENELENLPLGKHRTCVISGEWGAGKSNLLKYLKELALTRNTAVAYINLNGRASAVNHPQRFYHHIVSDLKVREVPEKGIIALLLCKLGNPSFVKMSNEWVSLNWDHSELARAFENLLNGSYGVESSLAVILGTDLAWSNYAYKKEKAIRRIEDLGSYLKTVGFNGLLIQFDELETIEQLWNSRSRQSAYKVLFTLINFKNVWSVFATTERFSQRLNHDKNGGIVNDPEAIGFAEDYFRLPTIKPPTFNLKLASELLNRILGLYGDVYAIPTGLNLQQSLESWSQMPFRNPRRLIRHAIDYLDRHRLVPAIQTSTCGSSRK